MNVELDVAIVGGGLVGASLAIALEGSGLRVALIEAAAPQAAAQPSYDDRNLALARASVNALQVLGVWPRAAASAVPIRHLHVSRAGDFGTVRLDASRHAVESFGAVVPARVLGAALLQQLDQCKTIQRLAPATLLRTTPTTHGMALAVSTAEGERSLHARLLVGADGSDSRVREQSGVGAETIDYAQTLFVTTLRPERALDGTAFERFSDEGPVALLPLTEQRAGLVLSVAADAVATVAAYSDEQFLAYAQRRFGWRAGRLSRPGKRIGYPIRAVGANAVTAPRTVLVGNAAQTLHPIGAQGFNLGLRDALTLAELLQDVARDGGDVGAAALLQTYLQRRSADRDSTRSFSDGLVRLACSPAPLLRPLRSLGLLLLDGLPPLGSAIARRGMGLRGNPSRYALGARP